MPVKQQDACQMRDLQWVHASSRDIELHEYLADISSTSQFSTSAKNDTWGVASPRRRAPPPVLPTPVSWMPFKLDANAMDLVQYCELVRSSLPFPFKTHAWPVELVAASTLATFGHDEPDLKQLLIRMSFSDNTTSSKGVLQAILALSSLCRYGIQSHAAQLKIRALEALGSSMGSSDMSEKEAMKHVAAGMVLCSYEASILVIISLGSGY